MGLLKRIRDWHRYERLEHYPALAVFDRESALKRLQQYEREERQRLRSKLIIVWTILLLVMILTIVLSFSIPSLRIFYVS